MATLKLKYDDIKLNGEVKLPRGYDYLGTGKVVGIDNLASLDGINEPIFTIVTDAPHSLRFTFGLKYTLKNYIQ